MKKRKFSFLVVIILVISTSQIFANGLSLNSIGPKALGMGGAFIGLADDYTAIYWNPAGLIGQDSGISLFTTDIIPFANYTYEAYQIEAKTKTNQYISPNLFANYNLGKFALGFGAYVPAGLGAEWNGDDLVAFSGPAGTSFEWMSEIGVFNFGPAFAYQVSEKFSVGAAMNIYYGMMKMKRPADMNYDYLADTQTEFDIKGMGYGATISLKWECLMTDKIDWGLSFRTPVNVAFEGDVVMGNTFDANMDIEWPLWIGFGGAYQANENLVFTLDGQYSNWSSLETLIAEIDMGGADPVEQEMHLEWENAVQIRIGTQYSVNDNFDLRGGFYYDPAPAPDKTVNILFPSSTNYVATTGFGYEIGKFNIDFGIEYLLGGERDIEAETIWHDMNQDGIQDPPDVDYYEAINHPGKHQMDILAFSLGFGYKFYSNK